MNLGRRNRVKAEGGMSSMTDLVFLLMIFFIIMSTMSNNTLPVDLPQNSESPVSSENPPLEIGITENSLYFFNADKPENYSFEEVIPILDAKMEKETDKSLRISGSKTANYEAVFNIIALAKQREWKPVLTYNR